MNLVLDASYSLLSHQLRDAALILSAIIFLPLSTLVLSSSYVLSTFFKSKIIIARQKKRSLPHFRARTILVTGVGMTKGLCLARMFYEAGHNVIGADFSNFVCGKHSVALKRYHCLQKPSGNMGSMLYIQALIDIVVENDVELWVSCSDVASAMADGQAKERIEALTDCKSVQFNTKDIEMLHEKHKFIKQTKNIGLAVPETHTVTSQAEVKKALQNATPGRTFIMKPVGMVDAARSDMTLLPLSNTQATEQHLSRKEISATSQWILQQYISGPEYCTHALVIRGVVKAFTACPSADLLMHYEALPAESALCSKMLEFTKTYARAGGKDFTGHLSFDFMVEKEALRDLNTAIIYPIECNPRVHTAVALFNDEAAAMIDAYMSLLKPDKKGMEEEVRPVIPQAPQKYYWIGHDLFEFGLLPVLSLIFMQISPFDVLAHFQTLLTHLLFWKDGTYETWDPLPWWWLYHIYWPLRFWSSLTGGRKWSRVNTSTTKMFAC